MTLNQIKDKQYVRAVESKAIYRRVRNQIYELHPIAKIWLSRAILFSDSCNIQVALLSSSEIQALPQ